MSVELGQKSVTAKKEAVGGDVEKHCGMISGLKEIPRGILSPSLEKKCER